MITGIFINTMCTFLLFKLLKILHINEMINEMSNIINAKHCRKQWKITMVNQDISEKLCQITYLK